MAEERFKFDSKVPFSVVSRDGVEVNQVITPEKATDEQTKKPEEGQTKEPAKEPAAEAKMPEQKTEDSKDKTPAEQKQPETTPKPAAPSLEEILTQKTGGKFKDVDTLLAELSKPQENKYKDDYIKKIVNYYEEKGDLRPVLEALTTDWNKVADEDLFMQDIKDHYPTLSKKALQKVYEKEVIAKYNLDEENNEPEDVEVGKELFKAEAQKLRDAKVQAQAAFKIPEPAARQPELDQAAIEAARQQDILVVKNDPVTQELLNNKRVVVKYDGGEFNYEVVNPQDYLEMTVNTNKVYQLFRKEDGQVDLGKFFRAMAYASDEQKFIQSLKTHFKSLGTEEVMKEIKNPKAPEDKGKAPAASADDFPTGLAKAFASAKAVHT